MTLGIPRLRELFMTATKSIKTPVMTLPLLPGKTKEDAEGLANTLRRIRLAEVTPPPLPLCLLTIITLCIEVRQTHSQGTPPPLPPATPSPSTPCTPKAWDSLAKPPPLRPRG